MADYYFSGVERVVPVTNLHNRLFTQGSAGPYEDTPAGRMAMSAAIRLRQFNEGSRLPCPYRQPAWRPGKE